MILNSLKSKVVCRSAIHDHSTTIGDHGIGAEMIALTYALVRNQLFFSLSLQRQKRLDGDVRAELPSKK